MSESMTDSRATFARLRALHPEIVYESFSMVERPGVLDLAFEFSLIGGPRFRPTLTMPMPRSESRTIDRALLENLVFHIGLVELVSYWKAACPPVVRLRAGRLNEAQQAWWGDLYLNGLGEFFYLNGIEPDPATLVRFVNDSETAFVPRACEAGEGNLIPIGGGKDSLVTLALLEPEHDRNLCFLLNRSRAQEESARLFGYGPERTVVARRVLDPALLGLNRQGYLNGHTPFSALLGFTTLLAAALHGTGRIALSNESSASEPTVAGSLVNHQYSKSWLFEQAFADYSAAHLTPSLAYFSFLRPWNELQIARRFASIDGALGVFRSCNVGSKEDRWCGQCAKCLFVDILLSPFVDVKKRTALFGGILPLDRGELEPLFEQLIGAVPVKPFECVGTVEEVRAALTLSLSRSEDQGEPPALLRRFAEAHAGLKVAPERIDALLSEFNSHHHLPASLLPFLRF